MNFVKGNNHFDLEIMIDDFMTFFIAGQETTANTLAFCFLELCKNPGVLKKWVFFYFRTKYTPKSNLI
jgi:cytochrome P450